MNNKQNISLLLKQNFASGLVVFLVALPLCLGIALASGAPPLAEILSGVIGCVIVGALSSSHISVSGPAAGLAAMTELGSFELFLCSGVIAGALQLLLGFLRAGSISNYIPISVIEGMLAGIGVIIILKQLPYALGSDDTLIEIVHSTGRVHLGSLVVAVVAFIIMIGWEEQPRLR